MLKSFQIHQIYFLKHDFGVNQKANLVKKKHFAINAHWLNFRLVGHITLYEYNLPITTII